MTMKTIHENVPVCRTIFDAIRHNRLDAVKVFLIFGSTVDSRDAEGWTPLHYAAWHDRGEIFTYLLSRGADLDALSLGGETPYLLALKSEATGVLHLLGASEKAAVSSAKFSPPCARFNACSPR